jgi:hypothetical protein
MRGGSHDGAGLTQTWRCEEHAVVGTQLAYRAKLGATVEVCTAGEPFGGVATVRQVYLASSLI